MDLSVIIVSWNTCQIAAECLASVTRERTDASSEVWVVDNASSNGGATLVRETFPDVHLIENRENMGFATANNQAIAASSGRYVLLLNSDTVVHPGAFDVLVRFMDERPEAGAAGPLTLNPNGTLQLSCYPSPTLARELWFLLHLDRLHPYGVYPMARWNHGQPRPVDAVLGACLMVRRSVLEQVGVLDPAYFMYSEEIDLCYRIQRAGWRIYWAPTAVIDHYGGPGTRQVAASMFTISRQSVLFPQEPRPLGCRRLQAGVAGCRPAAAGADAVASLRDQRHGGSAIWRWPAAIGESAAHAAGAMSRPHSPAAPARASAQDRSGHKLAGRDFGSRRS